MSLSLPHALDWCEESIGRYKHYKKHYNRTKKALGDCLNCPYNADLTCCQFVNEDTLFYYFCVGEIRNMFFQLASYIYYFAIKQNKKKYLEIKEQFKIYMTESMEYYEEACENNLINEGIYKNEVETTAETYNDAMAWCDNLEQCEGWWELRARGKKVHTIFAAI